MIKKICLECNSEFNAIKPNRKFCSMKCYHKQAISHKKGKSSPFWKGKKAKYGSIHDFVKSILGVATRCDNPNCKYPKKTKNGVLVKPKSFDWALKKGRKYTDRKVDSFIQLCRSCHQKYDFKEKVRERAKNGVFKSNKKKRKPTFWDNKSKCSKS